ncbi:uncharacterized protein DDB_G0283697-like [Leptopilina boulardi]|uniref:uncharacterized protein DDB_G0283697-like n=1 Tax=Leptopilina boulardi TaxID=63433 RepID=UPI0021F5D1EA|nr:uncharacterized protein DDB_G0283697-like [Leptopilina boulardi]
MNGKMGLRDDVQKLTSMPSLNDGTETKFVPLSDRGRGEKDRDMNKRHARVKNGNRSFYEEEEEEENVDDDNQAIGEDFAYNIRSSLRAMNVRGNDHIEQYIKKRQELKEKQLEIEKQQVKSESQETDDSTVSRLWKNGVIRGLVKKNIISKSDLVNNTTTNVEEKIPEEDKKKDHSSNVLLVEDPNDPDLLLHPLLAHGKIEYEEEFILERVGKKTTITPRTYYQSLGDKDFEFQKKKK